MTIQICDAAFLLVLTIVWWDLDLTSKHILLYRNTYTIWQFCSQKSISKHDKFQALGITVSRIIPLTGWWHLHMTPDITDKTEHTLSRLHSPVATLGLSTALDSRSQPRPGPWRRRLQSHSSASDSGSGQHRAARLSHEYVWNFHRSFRKDTHPK